VVEPLPAEDRERGDHEALDERELLEAAQVLPVVGNEEPDACRDQHHAEPEQKALDEPLPVRRGRQRAADAKRVLDVLRRDESALGPLQDVSSGVHGSLGSPPIAAVGGRLRRTFRAACPATDRPRRRSIRHRHDGA
jgi:hypothetical protein